MKVNFQGRCKVVGELCRVLDSILGVLGGVLVVRPGCLLESVSKMGRI